MDRATANAMADALIAQHKTRRRKPGIGTYLSRIFFWAVIGFVVVLIVTV